MTGIVRRRPLTGLGVALVLSLLAAGPPVTAPAAAVPSRLSACPRVEVLASRGSGDLLGKDKGLSAPGSVFTTRLESLIGDVEPWANPYHAVGVFSWNLRKLAPALINGLGAATKLSGLGLGAYHDSVVGGKRLLEDEIDTLSRDCPGTTKLVLIGYSQGAQVTADVYQHSLTATQRNAVAAIVLFGDPYFNGGDRAVDRGSFSGRRDGFLGRRPAFGSTGKTLVLSYCHSHDPICQGVLFRVGPTRTLDTGALTFRQHLNYTSFSEPQQAATLVASLLRAATTQPAASSWPTKRNDGPPALFIWLGASFLAPSWSSCDATYCVVGVDSEQRVYVFEIDNGIKELGWVAENFDPRATLLSAHMSEADVNALLAPTG